ncbi:MAG TPA: hypothetical protein VIC04_09065 [Terriglobia bacterium]|jgi:hypothetical protein
MKLSNLLFALLLTCGLGGVAFGDVLILNDGQAVTGKFQGGDPSGITFLVDGQYRRYQLTDVQSITIMPAPVSSAPAPAPSYSSGRSGGSTYSTQPAPAASAPRPSSTGTGVTLPAGTVITVRMIDTVDSSVHQVGDTFRASLDEPIIVGARTIASRGADVMTKLVSVEEAGRIQGRSELALVLQEITINGRKYEVTTEEVAEAGGSRGAQSAKRIGGLAAVGAVIGAIAGGGKGAAQGAAAGAGAGTAIQVMTKGEKVQIPAESRLDFTLAQPLPVSF